MKLVAQINDYLHQMVEIPEETWKALLPKDMLGIPHFHFTDSDGAMYVWPKPIPDCEVFRLEPQSFVKE